MPSGGARAGAGRPQDPNALRTDRRKDNSTLIELPADGRQGDPPPWPLAGLTGRESEMWAVYWRKPQAIVWERNHLVEVAALFVRQFCEGELPGNSAENRKAIQSYFSVLCLTLPALRSAGYSIADSAKESGEAETTTAQRRPSSKTRLKVVRDEDSEH